MVRVTGPGVLDVCTWEGDDYLAVHLVNLTNPMMMRGPIRELYPVGPQQMSLPLPRGRTPHDVRLLVSQADAKSSVSDQLLHLTVPSIIDHEVVAVVLNRG